MNQKELNKILENHKHWLNADCYGWKDMRADLVDENLSGANLETANLTYVNLGGANLKGANLKNAVLKQAFLGDAVLNGADFSNADLCYAGLQGASLVDAILIDADFREADFRDADLAYANLAGANLIGANLAGTNLENANLNGTNLAGTNLRGAKNIPFIPLACPDNGTFTAYKKASGHIVKLQIPKDAKRLSATGRKCRCDKAKVLEIQNLDGTLADVTKVGSNFDGTFIYEVGKIVSVSDFDEDRWNECSTGIHFFVNRQEAVNW